MARPDLIRPPVVLYAAFSEVASGGSPAGVVVDASELDAETMQQIAHAIFATHHHGYGRPPFSET